MRVLAISGCLSPRDNDFMPGHWPLRFHDAAAVLTEHGRVVAAIEQERLDRVKHSTAFPAEAISACLRHARLRLGDVDRFAFFFGEPYLDRELYRLYTRHPALPVRSARELLTDRVREHFDYDLPAEAVVFVPHHAAHAWSAFPQSGFSDALVVVIDGAGDDEALSVYSAGGDGMTRLTTYPVSASLGYFYLAGTRLLGYDLGDEYKVMGLAPHGDPATYRQVFQSLYDLSRDGEFHADHADLPLAFDRVGFPLRRRGGEFGKPHRDFAAGLQEALERIARHVICHWRHATAHRRIVIAGGVGQNCTLGGALLRSGFDDAFVHPAAHDAGAALGAALQVQHAHGGVVPGERIRHVFWGPALPGTDSVEQLLERWGRFVTFDRSAHVERDAAELLATGRVIGWVQGRSEFGPRALGHRSILADPRPETNRDRVNLLVKQRESYRPFAPSIQAEHLHEYVEFPAQMPVPDFMVFTTAVRQATRHLLGAVTHVDGSARVHAVDEQVNPRFWRLLKEFAALTGVPVLLNTSFNNDVEPIVDSVEDALRCYLTTDLDHLVIGHLIVTRRPWTDDDLAGLVPTLAPHARLLAEHTPGRGTHHRIGIGRPGGRERDIDPATHQVLSRVDGRSPLHQLHRGDGWDRLLAEARQLWRERYVDLRP